MTTIAIDTTSIFELAKPCRLTPTGEWGPRTVDAFSLARQLRGGTGYEVELWQRIDGMLTRVARTTKHIKITGTDVTVTFGGHPYTVGTVV